MIYGVIMAGGVGERFWPHSRISRPKQFLCLTSDSTMLAETIERVRPLIPIDRIRIVTGESMVALTKDSQVDITDKQILGEPIGRNTCLAIGLAAAHIRHEDAKGVLVVLSADHLIRPASKLLQIIQEGCDIAVTGNHLITIGIVPTRPETAYGYIKMGEEFHTDSPCSVFQVAAFAEKPKAVIAQEYYHSRKYLWNSGMFIWSAQAILDAINLCEPELGKLLESYAATIGTPEEAGAKELLYREAISISIDYAVLEKAKNVLTIKADIVWDDVGSWNALERYMDRNSDNNVVVGEVTFHESYEITVFNKQPGLVACLGVTDLVIVRSGDVTLVAHKSKMGQIKEMLVQVKEDEKLNHYL